MANGQMKVRNEKSFLIQLNPRRVRVDISDSYESTGQYQFSDIIAWNAGGNLLLWNDVFLLLYVGRMIDLLNLSGFMCV